MTATVLSYIVMGVGAGFCVAAAVGAALLGRRPNKQNRKSDLRSRSAAYAPRTSEDIVDQARAAHEEALERSVLQREQAAKGFREAAFFFFHMDHEPHSGGEGSTSSNKMTAVKRSKILRASGEHQSNELLHDKMPA